MYKYFNAVTCVLRLQMGHDGGKTHAQSWSVERDSTEWNSEHGVISSFCHNVISYFFLVPKLSAGSYGVLFQGNVHSHHFVHPTLTGLNLAYNMFDFPNVLVTFSNQDLLIGPFWHHPDFFFSLHAYLMPQKCFQVVFDKSL